MANEFQIKGLDAALRKLRDVAPQLRKKGLVAAVRKGALIVRRAAAANAKRFDDPRTAQQIAKEVTTRVNSKKGRQLGGVVVQVGVRGGAKAYVNNRKNRSAGKVGQSYEGGGNVYHWRFLEFGTSKMPAQPFMRPAIENNVQAATAAIVSELVPQIDKAVARAK